MPASELIDQLRALDVQGGEHVALTIEPSVGLGLAARGKMFHVDADLVSTVRLVDGAIGPRWVWWDKSTSLALASLGIPIDRCWDVIAVHRLLSGGWRWSIQSTWASIKGLSADSIPQLGQMDLLDSAQGADADPDSPLQPDGHIRPEWADSAWAASPTSLAQWSLLALEAAALQTARLLDSEDPTRALSTAHAESAAALLCAELESNGLPIDEQRALDILQESIGPRAATVREEDILRAERDERVLELLEPRQEINLRNSAEVKAMLRRLDIDVADTRAWRLEQVREAHPVVDALLTWRKSERIASTYGYRWVDEHVSEGRLRGEWSSADGSAGRMTASAGLHNLPSDMRPAVRSDHEHAFVRADLGQIEPRVLAAVSGDSAFIRATRRDDLYAEVAEQLRVSRDVAKLAVLGAMYGATTGESAHALRRLESTYPVAMEFLAQAAKSGRERVDLRTIGGRRIRLSGPSDDSERSPGNLDAAQTAAASRGRYARNAVIQGAAAEFFKVWAIVVRRRVRPLGATIVLCLHDELLVHTPHAHADRTAQMVREAIDEAAHFWSPSADVRFVADVSVINRWSEAKN